MSPHTTDCSSWFRITYQDVTALYKSVPDHHFTPVTMETAHRAVPLISPLMFPLYLKIVKYSRRPHHSLYMWQRRYAVFEGAWRIGRAPDCHASHSLYRDTQLQVAEILCNLGDPTNLCASRFKAYFTLNNWLITQQTRDVVLMLGQCWASVVDGGPALAQHRDNVSCLLGRHRL